MVSYNQEEGRIPVVQEFSLAGLTPPDVLNQMRKFPFPFLLESPKKEKELGRYSFVGCDPFMTFRSKGNSIVIYESGKKSEFYGHPIDTLRSIFCRFSLTKKQNFPLFQGGAVGMFSYDLHHFFEELPCTTSDDLNLPDIFLLFVDALIIFEHFTDKIYLLSTGYPENIPERVSKRICKRMNFLENFIEKAGKCRLSSVPDILPSSNLESNFSRKSFEKAVRKAKSYIKAGDIFQVNISQRMNVRFDYDPFLLYRILRQVNPSPFGCFMDFSDFQVVSSSPERLVKKDGLNVETRPIAGTRPRGKNEMEDKDFSSELFLNEKERAEHIMLVDLERNDLGRICDFGSVYVSDLMVIEKYSHVFHIVSNVKGKLLAKRDVFDVLQACFPGGTITGAPKIRSMEIIDELEPTRRGLYTGSIGYISFAGDMDINIVIRTFVIKEKEAFIQVGCGVVADSVAEEEYFETLYKAQALLLVLGYNDIHNL